MYGAGKGTGRMLLDDRPVRVNRPSDALRHGITLIPEDRKAEGLHLELPVRWNLAMATLDQRARAGIIRMHAEKEFAAQAVEQLNIKLGSPFQAASTLSGGTQQKVVIGKFMARKPSVLLFVDPTRGIDVQTKFGFYEMIRELAAGGATCLLYSSDTEELVGLCDRIAVFCDGVPLRVLEGPEINLDTVVAASFAVTPPNPLMATPSPALRVTHPPALKLAAWATSPRRAAVALVLLVLDVIFSGGTLSSIQALGITNQQAAVSPGCCGRNTGGPDERH